MTHSTMARAASVAWAQAVTANPHTLFLDTETLGKEKDAEICDIGLVRIDGTVELDQLIKPTIPIPADASAIHGITNEMVADAPTWEEFWPLSDVLFSGPLVVFNAGYDVPILKHAFKCVGSEPVIEAQCAMLEFARYMGVPGFKGQWKWHRLDIACAEFGIQPGGHRALADAEACRQVVIAMAGGQEVCWKCGARLPSSHAICECLRWVHEGKPAPPGQEQLF